VTSAHDHHDNAVSLFPTALVMAFVSAGSMQNRFETIARLLPASLARVQPDAGEQSSHSDVAGSASEPHSTSQQSILTHAIQATQHLQSAHRPIFGVSGPSADPRVRLGTAPHQANNSSGGASSTDAELVSLLGVFLGVDVLIQALLGFKIFSNKILVEIGTRVQRELLQAAAKYARSKTFARSPARSLRSKPASLSPKSATPRRRNAKTHGEIMDEPLCARAASNAFGADHNFELASSTKFSSLGERMPVSFCSVQKDQGPAESLSMDDGWDSAPTSPAEYSVLGPAARVASTQMQRNFGSRSESPHEHVAAPANGRQHGGMRSITVSTLHGASHRPGGSAEDFSHQRTTSVRTDSAAAADRALLRHSPRADGRSRRSPRAKTTPSEICPQCLQSCEIPRDDIPSLLVACVSLTALDGAVQAILGHLRQAQRTSSGKQLQAETLMRYSMLCTEVTKFRAAAAAGGVQLIATPLLGSSVPVSPLTAADMARELRRSPNASNTGLNTVSPFLQLVRRTATGAAQREAATARGAVPADNTSAVNPSRLFRELDATIEQNHSVGVLPASIGLAAVPGQPADWVSGLRQAHWRGQGKLPAPQREGTPPVPTVVPAAFHVKQAWALARVPLRVVQAANAFMANCVRAASRRDACAALLTEPSTQVKLLRQMQCPTSCILSLHNQRVTEGKYSRAAKAVSASPHLLQAIAAGTSRSHSTSAFLSLHSAAVTLTGGRPNHSAHDSRPAGKSVGEATQLALQVLSTPADASASATAGNSPLCLALALSGIMPTVSTLQSQSAFAKEYQIREKLGRPQIAERSMHPVTRLFAVVPSSFMRNNSKALMRAASRHVMRQVQSRSHGDMLHSAATALTEGAAVGARSTDPVPPAHSAASKLAVDTSKADSLPQDWMDTALGIAVSFEQGEQGEPGPGTPLLSTPSSFRVDSSDAAGQGATAALRALGSFRRLKQAVRAAGGTAASPHAGVPTPMRRVVIAENRGSSNTWVQRADSEDFEDIDAISVGSDDLFLDTPTQMTPAAKHRQVEKTAGQQPALQQVKQPPAPATHSGSKVGFSTSGSSRQRVNGWRTAIQRFPRLLHILQQLSAVQLLAQQRKAREKLLFAANERKAMREDGRRRLHARLRRHHAMDQLPHTGDASDERSVTTGSSVLGKSVVRRSKGLPAGMLDSATSALHESMTRSHGHGSHLAASAAVEGVQGGAQRGERLRSLRQQSKRQQALKSRSTSRQSDLGSPQLGREAQRVMRSVQPAPFSSHDTSAAGMLAAGRFTAHLPAVARRTSVHPESHKTLTVGSFARGGAGVDFSGALSASAPALRQRPGSAAASVASGTTGYSARSSTAFAHLVPSVAGAVSMGRGRFKQQLLQRARAAAAATVHDRLHNQATESSRAVQRGNASGPAVHIRGGHKYVVLEGSDDGSSVHVGAELVGAAAVAGLESRGVPADARVRKPDGTPLSLLELLEIAEDNSSDLSGAGDSESDSDNSTDLIVGHVDVRSVLHKSSSRDEAVFGVQEADIEQFQTWVDGIGIAAALTHISEAASRGRHAGHAPRSPRPALVGAALLGFIRQDRHKRRQARNTSAVRKLASLAALQRTAGPWGLRVSTDGASGAKISSPADTPAASGEAGRNQHKTSTTTLFKQHKPRNSQQPGPFPGAVDVGTDQRQVRVKSAGGAARAQQMDSKAQQGAPARAAVVSRLRRASGQYAKAPSRSEMSFVTSSGGQRGGGLRPQSAAAASSDSLLPVISAADFVMAQQLNAERRQHVHSTTAAAAPPSLGHGGGLLELPSAQSLAQVSTQDSFSGVAKAAGTHSPIRKRHQKFSSIAPTAEASFSLQGGGSSPQGGPWAALQSPFPQLQHPSTHGNNAATPVFDDKHFSLPGEHVSSPAGGGGSNSTMHAPARLPVQREQLSPGVALSPLVQMSPQMSVSSSSSSSSGAAGTASPAQWPQLGGRGGAGSTLPSIPARASSASRRRSKRQSALGQIASPGPITSLGSFMRRLQSPSPTSGGGSSSQELLRVDTVLNITANRVEEAFSAHAPLRQAAQEERATSDTAAALDVRRMLQGSREGGHTRRLQGIHAQKNATL